MYNSNKLRGRIIEMYGTLGKFAEAMDMSLSCLSNRLSGKTSWTSEEKMKATELLGYKHHSTLF